MRTLPPLPSVQSLRVLDAAVQRQSFSAAAQDLGLTHGAVSRQIRQLEALTGVVLFRRRGSRMEPTHAALAFAVRSGYALRTLADVFARPAARGATQRLRLATTGPFARFWLAPRLEDLLVLRGAQLATIETSLDPVPFKAANIDVAIRYGRGEWPGSESQLLGVERTFPVASPAFARRLREWDITSIAAAPLISNTFISWRAWLGAAGLPATAPLNVALETSDTAFSFDAAAAGIGIALARARLVAPLIARGELLALSKVTFDDGHAYYLAWPSDSRRRQAISSLGGWLQTEFERESSELGLRIPRDRTARPSV